VKVSRDDTNWNPSQRSAGINRPEVHEARDNIPVFAVLSRLVQELPCAELERMSACFCALIVLCACLIVCFVPVCFASGVTAAILQRFLFASAVSVCEAFVEAISECESTCNFVEEQKRGCEVEVQRKRSEGSENVKAKTS